jgi:hypothetical protein
MYVLVMEKSEINRVQNRGKKIDPEGLSQFPWGSHNGGAQWGKTGKNTTVYNGRETTRK